MCAKALAALFISLCGLSLFSQTPNLRGLGTVGPRPRITQAVNPERVVPLKGNVHPLARAQYDRGAAPDSLPAERMLLVLQRSPEQQAALDQLLQEQQTQGSPNYHRWLTPQEFGDTFGPAESDVNVITNWLTANGFQVNKVAAARNVVEFSGTAGQVRQAFRTQIRKYNVKGEDHWANASDPEIPEALAPVVAGVASLHDFRKKPFSHGIAEALKPNSGQVGPQYKWSASERGVAPSDFATIYNVKPLWDAGIDGTGQTVAIVGRTNINAAEVSDFRATFGLPVNNPEIVLNGPDPGIVSDGEALEAYLDVEWSGAVAKMAKIKFVVSAGTLVTDGVDLSAMHVVDNNLAPVMSVSFGLCETSLGATENQFLSALWQQAAAQGITVFVSAGDNGSAGCDDQGLQNGNNFVAASKGLAVSGLASTPYNVAVGGTDFDQPTLDTYWDSTTGNAKSYIPERTWNDSCAQTGFAGGCTSATIGSEGIWAGSGGFSSVYSKPAWQSGTGVPSPDHRYLPDVSLMSGTGSNSSFYIVCAGKCTTTNNINGVGGTSAAAPSFAGIMALVNQKAQGRQGNANFVFYNLARQANATCDSSDPTKVVAGNSCIFYDTTKGNISVPCTAGTGCSGGVMVDPNSPGTRAWTATTAYDQATGLGSVNAYNLANNWTSANFTPTTTTVTTLTPTTLTHGASANVSVTVAPTSGGGTPTGDVSLLAKYTNGDVVAFDRFALPVTNQATTALPGGSYNVVARYEGNGTFARSESAGTPVNVAAQNSKTVVTLLAIDYNAGTLNGVTSAVYGSPYILRLWVMDSASSPSSPLCEATNRSTCPTGTLTLTDNSNPLDGGSFALNGLGHVDDENIQLNGGTHNIAASYPGDLSYKSSTGSSTVTITKAPTATSAPTNPGTVATNTNVDISATVTAANSNGEGPAGTVTFLDNGTAMTGTVNYVRTPFSATGPPTTKATITTQFTTAGTHQVTARYNTDTNYLGSTSTATAITVGGGTTGDFTIAASPTSATVTKGSSGTSTVTVTSTGGFNSAVALTCGVTPAVSKGPTCTLSPASVTPAADGSATSTLTVATTGTRVVGSNRGLGWTLAGGSGVFAIVLLGIPGVRRRGATMVLMLLVALMLVGGGTVACGGGGSSSGGGGSTSPGTPSGSYTVTVTGTSGTLTHTTTYTVTVP